MKNPVLEATKELGRVVVIAVIPILASALEAGSVDWKLVAVAAAIAALRALDKYVHENSNIKANGIVPF